LHWENLNVVMLGNGVSKVDFKGFMAHNAHAKWNVVRKVYNNDDLTISLEGHKHTCIFIDLLTQNKCKHCCNTTQATWHGIQGCQEYGRGGCQIPCNMRLVVVTRSNHRGWHVLLVRVIRVLALLESMEMSQAHCK
jgi:hypothetical protein